MDDLMHILTLKQAAVWMKLSLPEGFAECSLLRLFGCYNGVGAQWMPHRMRRLLTEWFSFLAAASLIHDYEFTCLPKSYWNFTKANLRLAYNAAKSGKLLTGSAAAVICQLFGWSAYKPGKVSQNGTP